MVTARLQLFDDGVARAVEPVEHRHAVAVRILPGEQRRAAGRADRVGDERVGEPGAGGGQTVEVRCLVDLRAIGRDRMLGVVVREDEDDVGPHRRRRDAGPAQAGDGDQPGPEQREFEQGTHGEVSPTPGNAVTAISAAPHRSQGII